MKRVFLINFTIDFTSSPIYDVTHTGKYVKISSREAILNLKHTDHSL